MRFALTPMMIERSPTFDRERCKAHVCLANVEVFRRLVQQDAESEVAIVFASEGEMNNGKFTFNYECSNLFPVQVTRELAFKINNLVFAHDRVFAQQLNEAWASPDGRQIFMAILAKITNSDNGGSKVNNPSPVPINPGPTGFALETPKQAEA